MLALLALSLCICFSFFLECSSSRWLASSLPYLLRLMSSFPKKGFHKPSHPKCLLPLLGVSCTFIPLMFSLFTKSTQRLNLELDVVSSIMEPGMDPHAPAQPRLAMWAPWLPKVLHSNAFMYGLENERWKGTPNHFLNWENQGTLWAQMVMQKQRLWVWKVKNIR